jgi:hypothetical protein
VAGLIGLDRSISILEAERAVVGDALGKFQKAPPNKPGANLLTLQTVGRLLRDVERGPRFDFVGRRAPNADKMHALLKADMANGRPKKIRQLLVILKRKGLVADVSAETRTMVTAFLANDKTFACKTRGVYQLRRA